MRLHYTLRSVAGQTPQTETGMLRMSETRRKSIAMSQSADGMSNHEPRVDGATREWQVHPGSSMTVSAHVASTTRG
ncbi:hypothetical protein N658DRAFT_494467 [Parathielavia hyrcaniae]|uniref:Uncharacterized protein n=1 Tax=Parathielavia hyrcaniae TaxID=113614 RepID=A0AAN6Q415_9PEZI|nr:hypothetical protein N658DRAFT_494467 [Parathielavia hyrcaniae]